jgi:hypothetical protein
MVNQPRRIIPSATIAIFLAILIGCTSTAPKFGPDDPHWRDNDDLDIDDPGSTDPDLIWQSIDRTVFDQAEELLDMDRDIRKLTGNMTEAMNVNSFDELPNSAWFTNRHGLSPMNREELIRGALSSSGPDTSSDWIVSRPKVQGMTPGFWITDARGEKYIIKFDPLGFPDLATGAAIVAGRFFYAVGYNVPEEFIVYWRPERLKIKDGLMFTDRRGVHRAFSEQDLQDILSRVERQPDGSIRSLASKLLPNVRGPFSFDGRRENDPNDWCPHQHRRELRALRVFCSLVNHFDIKDQNTMDVLAEMDGRRFLKHYLLDFGSALGSAGDRPQPPIHGYANLIDLRDVFVSTVTLGTKVWGWETAGPWINPSVGYFESKIFHPARWDPVYPIPPFENMTDRDAYWGAKMVMAFRDDDLRALIAAGQYRDSTAQMLLLKILGERRDQIGRYWFSKVSPVDYFELRSSGDSVLIGFDDLGVEYGLRQGGSYRYTIHLPVRVVARETNEPVLVLQPQEVTEFANRLDGKDQSDPDNQLLKIEVQVKRDGDDWRPPTRLWLWYHPDAERFQLVGVRH